jgi:acetyl-CoA acetyltransferase
MLPFRLEFQALIDKTKINPTEVGDIVVGTVLAPGSQRAIECRMAAFYAGFPGIFFIYIYIFYVKATCCTIENFVNVSNRALKKKEMASVTSHSKQFRFDSQLG